MILSLNRKVKNIVYIFTKDYKELIFLEVICNRAGGIPCGLSAKRGILTPLILSVKQVLCFINTVG
ncbi:hypothetical protein X792_00735 [Dehalococcoides mccartyi CG1]|nr:hypothetical protein X792_00735 [Dehalococcoides mccartyi CG1]